jgi:GGDEF domain-containing protein
VVAERVLAGVAALAAVGGKPISVSAGISLFPADGADPGSLIAATNAALAAAKATGGGQMMSAAVSEG